MLQLFQNDLQIIFQPINKNYTRLDPRQGLLIE